jgi:arylformamidase
MDQRELDDAYDQSKYAANQRQVLSRYATTSDLVRQRIGAPKRFAYGSTEVEGFDLYSTGRSNAPINVFIHGGAWRSGAAKDYGFPAEVFINSGAHYISLDFINVGQAAGSLVPMADQVRRAIAWIYRNASQFGGDPEKIYVSGHSSGGHLAGVVLTTDWSQEFGLPDNLVKGALCISGMYDLKPVRLSARSSYVQFTDEMENLLSPQRHIERIKTPAIVAYGSLETPEFQRQSEDFAAALKNAGKSVELIKADGYNHFEIAETLANPYGILGSAVLGQMMLRT